MLYKDAKFLGRHCLFLYTVLHAGPRAGYDLMQQSIVNLVLTNILMLYLNVSQASLTYQVHQQVKNHNLMCGNKC